MAKALGVKKFVILVNKMEDCNWLETRFDEIKKYLRIYLKDSGFEDKDLTWIPLSGLNGSNVIKTSNDCKWYQGEEDKDGKATPGKTLLEVIDEIEFEQDRNNEGPLRIPIIDTVRAEKDIYGNSGGWYGGRKIIDTEKYWVVHGKVESGKVSRGDKLEIQPSGHKA